MTVSLTDLRLEIHNSEPTERAELTPGDNGDRTSTILDDAADYMYAVAHVPNEAASGSLAHDTHTASATFTTTDPFTFTHTPSGTPWGALVIVLNSDDSDIGVSISEVTYGGMRMQLVSGGGSGGVSLAVYYLAGGVPSGAQTVSIDHDGNSDTKQAVCITFTSDRDVQIPVVTSLPITVETVNGSVGVAGTLANPYGETFLNRAGLRYTGIISEHDGTGDLTALSGQTEVVSGDFGTEVFRVYRTTTNVDGLATQGFESPTTPESAFFFAVAFEEVPFTSKLEIYDITDLDNPSLSGAVAAMENLVATRSRHAMAMDSSGDYLYVVGATGTMYTLDISTRTSPSLADTQVGVGNFAGRYDPLQLQELGRYTLPYTHTLHVIGSQVFRASADPGGGEITRYDISTPQSPSLTQTLTGLSLGVGVPDLPSRWGVGYVTPDSNFIYYPWANGVSTQPGYITIIDVNGTMTEAAVVQLPAVSSGGPAIHPLELSFLPNPTALQNRFVTVLCRYQNSTTEDYHYLWMTYQTASANDWDDITLYSHDESGGVADPDKISSSLLASGSAAGRVSAGQPPDHFRVVRAERGEDYMYVFVTRGFKGPLSGGIGFNRDPSSQGRLLTYEFTNLGLSLDSSVGRTLPRLVNSIEPYLLHDCGELHLTSSTLVGIGRNRALDDASLVTLNAPAGWTEITDALYSPGFVVSLGINGSGARDRVSDTGELSFVLDNTAAYGSLGRYSPDNANLVTGFRVGREIRLSADWDSSTYYVFWGAIYSITASSGQYLDRRSAVRCVDYMDYLSRAIARGLQTRFDESSAQGVHLVLNKAQSDPVGVYFLNSSGDVDTYPVMFDTTKDEGTAIVTELQKINQTERSFTYLVGGILYFEGRGLRAVAVDGSADLTLTDAEILNLNPEHTAENLLNEVSARVYPREYDAAVVVLFNYENTQEIAAGEKVEFRAPYKDPDQKAARVGGFEMVAPVLNTDYAFNTAEDGTGTDIGAQLEVAVTFSEEVDDSGNSADVSVLNRGPLPGYLTSFQLRGKGIYTYEPVSVDRVNRQNRAQYGVIQDNYDLPYHNLTPVAEDAAQYLIRKYGDPSTFVRSAEIRASDSSTLMDFIIKTRKLGLLVDISETLLGLSSVKYFIQSVSMRFQTGTDEIYATLGLVPADVESVFEFGDGAGSGSAFDGDDVFGSAFIT